MNFGKKILFFSFLISCLVFIASCATFKGRQLEPVTMKSIPENNEKPSMEVNFEYMQYMNGDKTQLFRQSAENKLHKDFMTIARNSGSFSKVEKDLSNPDITTKIIMKDKGSGNMIMAVITGLSLYIIPSQSTDNYILTADITNQTGKEWTIQMEDYITMYQQIFLLPVMPFKMLPEQANDVQDNMFRTLILRMHKKEII